LDTIDAAFKGDGTGTSVGLNVGSGKTLAVAGTLTATGTTTLTSPRIGTQISDTNGNELLKLTATASAVNELTLANAATGGAPVLSATGGDTNIGIALTPKGTGGVVFPAGAVGTPAITTSGDLNTGIYFPAADTIAFAEGGVEAMRLDSSGNLGLGVTPSAWSQGKAIEMANSGYGVWNGTNSIYSIANAYFNSGFKYANTGQEASHYYQFQGQHVWSTAPSGTAGNAITFTQAMTLDASGNLLLQQTRSYGQSANIYFEIGGTDNGYVDTGNTSSWRQYVAGNASGQSLRFDGYVRGTGWTERMRLDSSGNLLVGTTVSDARLHVVGPISNANTGVGCFRSTTVADTASCAASFVKYANDSTTSQVFIRFGINQYSAGSGQINANGANAAAFGTFSDRRLKENIADLSPQLNNIMAMRPVEFDYIASEGGGHQTGFIAQEVKEIYPDAVGERSSDGMLTVTGWSKTEARLVKAIQEQQAIIQTLTARVASLESN
jgi:hypothetical protein